MTPIDYGSAKSSGSVAESSGSGSFSDGGGSTDSGSSSGSSDSGSGSLEFAVINMHVENTHGGDPSIGDFIIANIGSIGGTITSITGTAVGFTATPASALPHHMDVGDQLFVFCNTAADEILSGTDLQIDYSGDNGETGTLYLVWIA